ncbi:MAG: dihydroorotate dehydrogenase electron transfer subunit [Candidatus Hodarchaeota archaeon]
MTENIVKTVRIKRVINDCKGVKTLIFNMKENSLEHYKIPKPGQFVMIWVPSIDEVPMSISGCDERNNWSITVKNVGECTNAIHNLKIGDYIGVRGPLGNYFEIPQDNTKNIILIAGGIGIAPLRFLLSELSRLNCQFKIIQGAKVDSELIHINEFSKLETKNSEILYCTDDGSYGIKGFASATFENLIMKFSDHNLSNSIAYTCGPEKMIYKIFQICEKYNIELQASLERIMRCGCGLCGLCALDPLGLLVCKDGPIFKSQTLRQMEDFGKYKRDFSGKKIPIE